MEESNTSESVPDLKDLEVKVGRKTPEGLLKWMREDHKIISHHHQTESNETENKGLDEKIRKLKLEMAHLRAADVKILNQLLALHEGIEAVKWLLEDRGMLTSRCSSLTSSQYSLGDGPDTSWRGSWSSLQDPNDKLDNISIGSYLDTLADDLDEYCPSSGTDSILCAAPMGTESSRGTGGGISSATASETRSPQVKSETPKEEAQIWSKAVSETGRQKPSVNYDSNQAQPSKTNEILDKAVKQMVGSDLSRACLTEKLGTSLNPKVKTHKNGKVEPETCKMNGKVELESCKMNGKVELETCKMNGKVELETCKMNGKVELETCKMNGKVELETCKMNGKVELETCKMNGKVELESCKINGKVQLEYDAHWLWVQSQDDVTFL